MYINKNSTRLYNKINQLKINICGQNRHRIKHTKNLAKSESLIIIIKQIAH